MWQALRIIWWILFFFGGPFLVNEYPLRALIIYLPIVILASIFLLYKKKKKKEVGDIIYGLIFYWLMFAIFGLIKAKDDIDIPQFSDWFIYYFPRILIAVWMIPTFIYAFGWALINILVILRSRWLDDMEKIKEEYYDYFWIALFIWRWIATIGLVIWWIFTPI